MIEILLNKNFGSKLEFSEAKESRFKKEEEVFIQIITSLNDNINKSVDLYTHYHIDIFDYNANFMIVIEDLFLLKYGPVVSEIIMWYLFDREILDEKGEISVLPLTLENHETGEVEDLYLTTPKELWDFIVKIDKPI